MCNVFRYIQYFYSLAAEAAFNPTALKTAKTLRSFGHSECKRFNGDEIDRLAFSRSKATETAVGT